MSEIQLLRQIAELQRENERLKRLLDQRGKDAADAEEQNERLRGAARDAYDWMLMPSDVYPNQQERLSEVRVNLRIALSEELQR